MKRMQHLAIIAHEMGIIFELLSVATLIPFAVLFYFQEWEMILPMATVPATFFLAGFAISRLPHEEHSPHLSIALVAVAITWLAIALVGAVPFILQFTCPHGQHL